MFGMEKLEWCGYPIMKKFEDMLFHFDTSHERDRQTDRHRVTAWAVLMHSITQQKWFSPKKTKTLSGLNVCEKTSIMPLSLP